MKKHILITLLLITSLVFTSVSQVNYQWVKSIGGTSGETSFDITTDNAGYVYITGKLASLDSVDFNPNGTTPVKLKVGLAACFIAKYDSVGNCIWAKNLQQGIPFGVSIGSAIATDNQSNVYVAGGFGGSVDFDPSSNTTSENSASNESDAFISKYNINGGFEWVKTIKGSHTELITAIVVDELSSGVYISGGFNSDTIVFSNTTDTIFNKGQKDAFLAGYDLNGTLLWKNSVGSSLDDIITDIDADDYYLVATGAYEDTLIFNETGTPPDTLLPSAGPSTFYGKYILDGSYGWMDKIGGNLGVAVGTGVAIENSNIHLTGVFFGIVDVDQYNTTLTSIGTDKNVFINKYDIGGNLAWAKPISPANSNAGNSATSTGIVVDEQDNVYVAGYFSGSVDFDPSSNDLLNTSNGVVSDFYFSKYTDAGEVVWAKTFGSDLVDTMVSIAIDSKNNIYLSGEYKDTVDFDPGSDVANRNSLGGNEDLFIAKYAQGTGTITGTITYGSSNTLLASPGNKVQLYTQVPNDGNATMQLVDEVIIDANAGTYTFSDVCAGTYYILAVASMDDYETVVATYYGDTTYWQFATAITVLSDSSYTKNINMVQSAILNGSATLSGYVLEGSGFDRVQGDPIPNRDIVLEEDPGNSIVTHVETDTNGYYEFVNVPAGCYKIYVNIPGLPMDSTHHECPTITDSIVKLNFVADSTSIGIIPSTTGIKQHSKAQQTQLSVYPNPYNGFLFAQLELQKESTVKLELYNIVGKKVLDLGSQTVKAGKTKIQINTKDNNIGSGIYFLKIVVNNKEVLNEKIIQID